MELYDKEDIKKSLKEAMDKELQPFEMSIAMLVQKYGFVDLDGKSIIGIHRACMICDEILRNQFDEKGLR